MGKSYQRKSRTDRKPLVSVIIPAYNEEKVIGRLLKSVKKQTWKNIEVIVVDDASTDRTAKIAGRFARVYIRAHAERSIQRNFGAKKAKGDFLLFLDADMELIEDVIRECVEKMERDGKIGGLNIPEESVATNFWERVKAFERTFYNLEGDEVTDAARFFRKSAFVKAGGYDETITGPEDWDLPDTISKKGYKISRIKAKLYHHERVPNPLSLAKKKYYYALKAPR